jgi:WD40 repeat protein
MNLPRRASAALYLLLVCLSCSGTRPGGVPAEDIGFAEDEPSAPDGRPLPPGVLCRIGTANLRHGGGACAVTFSPDSKTLATGGEDHLVSLWDAATGVERHRFVGHGIAVRAVALSPDGTRVAAGGGSLLIADLEDDFDIRL